MQKFLEEFQKVLHNKLLMIKKDKGLECLKKIPVHPNLCSLSMNTQMGCLVHRALAFATVKNINENTSQCHAHSEDTFLQNSS